VTGTGTKAGTVTEAVTGTGSEAGSGTRAETRTGKGTTANGANEKLGEVADDGVKASSSSPFTMYSAFFRNRQARL
jgi:hypothetical protein